MAVKVIKEKFIATCPICDCKFEYETEDIDCGWVWCPVCSGAVLHDDSEIYNYKRGE